MIKVSAAEFQHNICRCQDIALTPKRPQRHRIAPPIGSAQVGDRRQSKLLGMAEIVDHRLLFGLADAVGRPLLGREIDLQMLMSENAAVNARDVSGHGSDHC